MPSDTETLPLNEIQRSAAGQESPAKSAAQYKPAIDGLRAIAVLSVFFYHLGHDLLPGGFIGVDVFFVISGYLITSIIRKDCERDTFSLLGFYQRRIARILPAFFVMAMATIVASFWVYAGRHLSTTGTNLAAAAVSLANVRFLLFGTYFKVPTEVMPYLHCWSLSVEEQFYLFFPLLFLVIFKIARKRTPLVVAGLCLVSFVACAILTFRSPVWAFYMLPTRAWELLLGCFLAVSSGPRMSAKSVRWVSVAGLALIFAGLAMIHEGPQFPGYWALLPTLGTVFVLKSQSESQSDGPAVRLLSSAPLVLVGRMSYSLYLWHWPVFCLVDYRMYLASGMERLAAKVILTVAGTLLSFYLIEAPARTFLNRRKSRLMAYAVMIGTVTVSVCLGMTVKNAHYVNARASNVARGGVVFQPKAKGKPVVLMGDSIGSTYGKLMRDMAAEKGYRLMVVSVHGCDALPPAASTSDLRFSIWRDSLELIKREKPACVVFASDWINKLRQDKTRLAVAVEALKPYVGTLVLLTQQPVLPDNATRAAIRSGVRPPFREDPKAQLSRSKANEYVKSLAGGNVVVLDVATHLETPAGEILFTDPSGETLYDDLDHLSPAGTELIRPELTKIIDASLRP